MTILFISLGIRKTFILIIRYPGILILSTFTFWTIGPVKTSNCKDNRLRISYSLTWSNLIISMIMTTGFYVINLNMNIAQFLLVIACSIFVIGK